MNDIVPIIKNTLEVLKSNKTPVTPKAYEKEFFAQAHINGGADELTTINTILTSSKFTLRMYHEISGIFFIL